MHSMNLFDPVTSNSNINAAIKYKRSESSDVPQRTFKSRRGWGPGFGGVFWLVGLFR